MVERPKAYELESESEPEPESEPEWEERVCPLVAELKHEPSLYGTVYRAGSTYDSQYERSALGRWLREEGREEERRGKVAFDA